jgi:TIR domain
VAELLKPIGFWSYARSDDAHSGGRLGELRRLLADELHLLIGPRQSVQIFVDVATIPIGSDWLKEIYKALGESSFLIAIVTPAFLESEMCCREVMRFREREQELGRDDLIFPFHYIDVAHIEPGEVHDPSVLALLKSRQRRLRRVAASPGRVRGCGHEAGRARQGYLLGIAAARGGRSGSPTAGANALCASRTGCWAPYRTGGSANYSLGSAARSSGQYHSIYAGRACEVC